MSKKHSVFFNKKEDFHLYMNWEKAINIKREVSFQGRLDKVLERQKIKLNDNLIKLTGTPEDVIIIKKKTTQNGDTISKVIVDQKLINIIFPPLKDVPVRRITTEFEKGYKLVSLISAYGEGSDKGKGKDQKDLSTIDITIPLDSDLNVGDEIIRVFVQENLVSSIMVFDVLEITADMSNNAPLNLKAKIALSTEPIDMNKPTWQLIIALSKRRLAANY